MTDPEVAGRAAVPRVVMLEEAARPGSAGLGPEVVGSKAASLARLAAAGFPVPPGFVVTAGMPQTRVGQTDAGKATTGTDGTGTDGTADRSMGKDQAPGRDETLGEAFGEESGEAFLEELGRVAGRLGGGRFAVRSSALAEDLAEASFAGQYETVLDVPAGGLAVAVRQVLESAAAARVAAYTRARAQGRPAGQPAPGPGGAEGAGMAVLVQVMVDAEAAGVAFTADPVTGARDRVVVTAVRGLGERLVAGETDGDEWVVMQGRPTRRRDREGAIDAAQADRVARLARQVHALEGVPQDIEWAIAGGKLFLLQARPMTALPEPVDWTPPGSGLWMRNFRLGEWLPEPMTPLFATWLLELLEAGLHDGMRRTAGAAVVFPRAAVNGWYYTALSLRVPLQFPRALLASRGRIVRVLRIALVQVGQDPEKADRTLLGALARTWREESLPRYRRLVADAGARVETAGRDELTGIVETLGEAAGEALWWLELVGGAAWKMEGCLARACRDHLAGVLPDGVQVLLSGLPGAEPDLAVADHAVHSFDWYHPTMGELGWDRGTRDSVGGGDRRREVADARQRAETACRAALADRPELLARFESILRVTQRYAVIREEQARLVTLGWPPLRRCALRLGEALRADGVIDQAEDVFFLTRAELTGPWSDPRAGRQPRQQEVAGRRALWERQRRLAAPLTLGRAPWPLGDPVARTVEATRTQGAVPRDAIVGHPASPGRATGPARILRGPGDFDRFQSGEVLVAQATTPAWTPLFARAAAVVTDGGSLAAHASLVAREYGIPAVVGTGQATTRLTDGQVVTVDGGAGTVEPLR